MIFMLLAGLVPIIHIPSNGCFFLIIFTGFQCLDDFLLRFFIGVFSFAGSRPECLRWFHLLNSAAAGVAAPSGSSWHRSCLPEQQAGLLGKLSCLFHQQFSSGRHFVSNTGTTFSKSLAVPSKPLPALDTPCGKKGCGEKICIIGIMLSNSITALVTL
jgi:hypothetical protein